jgi:hypothetical protein
MKGEVLPTLFLETTQNLQTIDDSGDLISFNTKRL